MSPPDLLALIGRALHGEHWQNQFSASFHVSRDTIRKWMSGKAPLAPGHGILAEALAVVDAKIAELSGLRKQLAAMIRKRPER